MTATTRPTIAAGSSRSTRTVLVVDESTDTDVDALLAAMSDVCGAVTILVTTHPITPFVVGFGGGIDGAVLWSDWWNEQQAGHDATRRRVNELMHRLLTRLGGPIDRLDCAPTTRFFRSSRRREIDGVLRDLSRLGPGRVVVDERHHLFAELRAAIVASGW